LRGVFSELLSMAAVLSIPLGIVLSFPLSPFGFRATEVVRRPAQVAFVTMSPEAERLALRAVRASWRERVGGVRRLQADLFCAELPEDERMSVLTVRDRSRPPAPPMAECERTPFLPSQKAPPPRPIAAGAETVPPTFPREELLKMN